LSWKNPADKDLASVNIYLSDISGELGSLNQTVTATPSEDSTVNITGLTVGQNYWLVLRGVDTAGNESADASQYQVTVQ